MALPYNKKAGILSGLFATRYTENKFEVNIPGPCFPACHQLW